MLEDAEKITKQERQEKLKRLYETELLLEKQMEEKPKKEAEERPFQTQAQGTVCGNSNATIYATSDGCGWNIESILPLEPFKYQVDDSERKKKEQYRKALEDQLKENKRIREERAKMAAEDDLLGNSLITETMKKKPK